MRRRRLWIWLAVGVLALFATPLVRWVYFPRLPSAQLPDRWIDVNRPGSVGDRERYDHYQFGITRACGAIAESGTLVLNDETTSDRLAALAPWVHIAVLERHELIRSIPEAVDRFGDSPNIVWATGPSKTADVEGILIEGVHGPGEQIALLL